MLFPIELIYTQKYFHTYAFYTHTHIYTFFDIINAYAYCVFVRFSWCSKSAHAVFIINHFILIAYCAKLILLKRNKLKRRFGKNCVLCLLYMFAYQFNLVKYHLKSIPIQKKTYFVQFVTAIILLQ